MKNKELTCFIIKGMSINTGIISSGGSAVLPVTLVTKNTAEDEFGHLIPVVTCGGTLTYCGHPGCPDRTGRGKIALSEPAPEPLTATASCGGTATYCGHPGCPDLTGWRTSAMSEPAPEPLTPAPPNPFHSSWPSAAAPKPLTATPACGGSLIYCGCPGCPDLTIWKHLNTQKSSEPEPLAPAPPNPFHSSWPSSVVASEPEPLTPAPPNPFHL